MRRQYLPMLAGSAEKPFSSGDWIFEIKWDGIRALAYVGSGGSLSLRSRNNAELAQYFPELGELARLAKDVVLDGEIVVMRHGAADFQAVVRRAKATGQMDIQRLASRHPATYVAFDILEERGEDLTGKRLMERKAVLGRALREGKHVVVSAWVDGEGERYFQAALEKGVEGVMAKRKDGTYLAGRRSEAWLKIRRLKSCDCIVLGYTRGSGSRAGFFGALLLGVYDGGRLAYVGKVGTGFGDASMRELMEAFEPLKTDKVAVAPGEAGVQWLEPRLVAEVAFQAATDEGKLRMPRFRGIRPDKRAEECTMDQIRPNLEAYKGKRNFLASPEPPGGNPSEGGGVYVVQEHHARRLHYDLRLERDGVLKSWAVPKGIPLSQGEKRLAIMVEDHPIEYARFAGTIPEGEYGAGTVAIWDRGTYSSLAWGEDMIEFVISGERLKGRYVLARFKKAGDKQWLLFRAKDK